MASAKVVVEDDDEPNFNVNVNVNAPADNGIMSIDPENHTDEVAPRPFSIPQMEVELVELEVT